MRVVIYIRMSTDDQAGSPERQRAQILLYCERKGYTVVGVYEDHGLRGSDSSRPEFQRLLQDAQKGLFELIVVDEQSRLSRADTMEYIVTVAYPLRQAGVFVEVVDEGRRLTWDSDDLVGQLLGVIGQFKAANESVTLGRRTGTGMAKKAKEGKMFPGRAAYGYRYKLVDGKRVGYEPDTENPENVETVRRIFDAYANQDKSVMAVVAELNASGTPSPRGRRQWVKNTVTNILKNPVYAGCYVWGKVPQGKYFRYDGSEIRPVGKKANSSERRPSDKWVIIPGQHEPLAAPELFDRVQQLLAANRQRTSPSRKKDEYPLSQLMRCSNCGEPMYGTKDTSGGVKRAIYRCGGYMVRGKCAPRTVTEKDIIEHVTIILRKHLLDPVEQERLVAEIRRQNEQKGDADAGQVKGLRAKLTKLDGQIKRATDNLPLLDPEFLPGAQAQIRGWRTEQAAVQEELGRLTRRTPAGAVEDVTTKVERLVEVMNSGEAAMVRSVVRGVIARIDLQFDTVQKKKMTRYPLVGGVVHLIGCEDSDRSGPAAAR